jgi:hypothetical protein
VVATDTTVEQAALLTEAKAAKAKVRTQKKEEMRALALSQAWEWLEAEAQADQRLINPLTIRRILTFIYRYYVGLAKENIDK